MHGFSRTVAAAGVALIALAGAACSSSSSKHAAPTTAPPQPMVTGPPSTLFGPTTTATTATAPPSTQPAASYAAIAGTYAAGTADGGSLYIRSDGASRFSAPDEVKCSTCSTATAPISTLDFSLKTLTPTGSGSYRATGVITETSDEAWAQLFVPAPTIGISMSLTDDHGHVTVSFLPANDTLVDTAGAAGA